MSILKCFYIIGIATVPMLFSLTDDIKCDLKTIQRLLKDKNQRSKMIGKLSQFIRFHSDTRQLSLIFFQINALNPIVFFSFRLATDLSKLLEILFMMKCSYFIVGICSQLVLIKIKMVNKSTFQQFTCLNTLFFNYKLFF